MLNLDGAGRGKGGAESLTLAGRPELVPYFVEQSQEMHYRYTITDLLNAHSDHYPYAIRGIPAGTLSSPDDSAAMVGRGWGHTEADTFDKVNLRGLQMAAMTTARMLLRVAGDEGFPGYRLDRETLRKQQEDAGLDVALKRAGRWELVGGSLDGEATP
jgi:Zn-dependent M28 family amino/carboxypeptidase